MFQPELESLDREALARLQLERMRATLARCRRNAAWRRRLGDARPDDVTRAEDWAREELSLPIFPELYEGYGKFRFGVLIQGP